MGYTYIETEEWDRASRSLQTNLIATPDNASTYGYLGDAYWMRGDRKTSPKDLERKTGKRVVTSENYLNEPESRKRLLKK